MKITAYTRSAERRAKSDIGVKVDKEALKSQYQAFCSLAKDAAFHTTVFSTGSFRYGGQRADRA